MKKHFKATVLLAALLTLPFTVFAGDTVKGDGESAYHPLITHVKGDVMVMGENQSEWEPAEGGTLLYSGDIIKTGVDASAEIMFLSGKVQLYQNAVLIIPSTGVQDRKKDIKEVFVEEGSALFDINPTGVKREFEFRTKNLQGGVKGTRFTVSYLEGGTSVAVYRGKVVVSDLDRSEKSMKSLTAGRSVRAEGEKGFGKIRGFDPEFDVDNYSYTVPPGLDSRGMPADYNANPDNRGVRDRGAGGGREGAPGQNK